ncbi:hypothetical protein TetV_234 [Tetraselmis virus 1]|uniref:Uncharacterized protein n=1 Tax=Tetraselmis virus 1 TaxID=2060617 RepID=A0A2P0VN43_9VIRU|nr:hypothetical protein QJ968_gp234 [Tetraselmis virus 1]AUF82326.1 hypothetical protein TetV_234 [Tetraselmis virus 1]
MSDKRDPIFSTHYLGGLVATQSEVISSARNIPKEACSVSTHKCCHDCLTRLWYHDYIVKKTESDSCVLSKLMKLTIFMRRNQNVESNFQLFDSLMKKHISYVCRVVDARHLVSFITNYAMHSQNPVERAAAGIAVCYNMMEKINVSSPHTPGTLTKNTDKGVPDATFVRDGSFSKSCSNFTMYDWKKGNAMDRSMEIVLHSMKDTPIVKRLTMSCFAWGMQYPETLVGKMSKYGKEKKWKQMVVENYIR